MEDQEYWARCEALIAGASATCPGFEAVYLGHLDYDATDELFAQSDIVVVPSRWPEPLGAVALEAMAAGAAVVASQVGGLGDIIVHGRNGLHATAGDVDSFAAALSWLVGRPDDARRLGVQAHRDIADVSTEDHLRDLDDLVTAHRTDRHPPTPADRLAS